MTVVEFLDRILPGMDGEVAKQFQRILKKQGIEFKLGTKVTERRRKAARARRSPSSRPRAARPRRIEADVVLVAIGRVPYTDGLGLDEAGVAARQARPHRDRRAFRRPTCRASRRSAT